jgi:hypothetical protein
MINLRLVENAPRWRVAVVALTARALGITVKVDGIPFGGRRCMKRQPMSGAECSE